MLDAHVHELLAEFRDSATGQQLLDSEEAAGRCKPAALALLALLHERGLARARLLNYLRPHEHHYVVELDDMIIDPSTRQFSEHAQSEVPRIVAREEFETEWEPGPHIIDFSNTWDIRFIHKLPPQVPTWPSVRDGLPAREQGTGRPQDG